MRLLSLRQSLLLLALCLHTAGAAAAEEHAYDLLGRLLHPYAALLAEGGHEPRALTLAVRGEAATGEASALTGQRAEANLQYPDKLRLRAPWMGDEYTVCRRGGIIWVYPGSKLRALLARPEVAARLPEPDRKFQLRPFALPIPQRQLVFLPALFQARLRAPEPVAGVLCDVLDLQATPLLGKSLDVQAWSVRVWADAQAQLRRFTATGPSTQFTGLVEKAEFAAALPPETWVPAKDQESDVVLVPPVRYDQLLRAILGLK